MKNKANYEIIVKTDSTQIAKAKHELDKLREDVSHNMETKLTVDIRSLLEVLRALERVRVANHSIFNKVSSHATSTNTDMSNILPTSKMYTDTSARQRGIIGDLADNLNKQLINGNTRVDENFARAVAQIGTSVMSTESTLNTASRFLTGTNSNINQRITHMIKSLDVDDGLKKKLDDKHKKLIKDSETTGSKNELRNFQSLLKNSGNQSEFDTEDMAKIGALTHVDEQKKGLIALIDKSRKNTYTNLEKYADAGILNDPTAVSHAKQIKLLQKKEKEINERIQRFFKSIDSALGEAVKGTDKFKGIDDANIRGNMNKLDSNMFKLRGYNHSNVNASNIADREKELGKIVIDNDVIKKDLNKNFTDYIASNKEGLSELFEDAKRKYNDAIKDLRKAINSGRLSPAETEKATSIQADLINRRRNLDTDTSKLKNKVFTIEDAEALIDNPNLNTNDYIKGFEDIIRKSKDKTPPKLSFDDLYNKRLDEIKVVEDQTEAMVRSSYLKTSDYRQKYYSAMDYGGSTDYSQKEFVQDMIEEVSSTPRHELKKLYMEYNHSDTTEERKAELYNSMLYAKTNNQAINNRRHLELDMLKDNPVYRDKVIEDLQENLSQSKSFKKVLEGFKNSGKLSEESFKQIEESLVDVTEDINDFTHRIKTAKKAEMGKLTGLQRTFNMADNKQQEINHYSAEMRSNSSITADFNKMMRTSVYAVNSGIGSAKQATEANYETTKSYKVGADGKILDKHQFGERIKELAIGNAEETINDIQKQFEKALEVKDFGKIEKLTKQLQDLGLSKTIPANIKTINAHLKDDIGIEGIINNTKKKYQELHKKIGEDIDNIDKSDLPDDIKKQKKEVLKAFQVAIGKELKQLTALSKSVAGQDLSTDADAKKLGQLANNLKNSRNTHETLKNDYTLYDDFASRKFNPADFDEYSEKQKQVLNDMSKMNKGIDSSRDALDDQTKSMKAQAKVSQDLEKEIQRLITLETQYSRTIKARESYATRESIDKARAEQEHIRHERERLEAERDRYNSMSVADRHRNSNNMTAEIARSRGNAFEQQNSYGQSRADLGELTVFNRFKRIAENTAMFTAFTGAVALATGALVALGKEYLEFDKNVSMMTALLGEGNKSVAETREEMEQLELSLMDLGTVYGGTFEEINQSSLQLGRAGIQLADLHKATETALKLTKLTGGTMESSTDVLVSFITTYGKASATVEKSQANLKEIGDGLAFWSRMARGSMEDLNTFSTYALEASANAGLTTTATLALGASFNNLGMSASTAGTTTRTLMNSLGDTNPKIVEFYDRIGLKQDLLAEKFRKGGKDSEEALLMLSKRLQDISDADFAKLTKGMDTYDKHAMTSLRSASNRLEAYIKDAKKAQNELDKAKIATDNAQASWEKLVNNIKLAFHGIAEFIGEATKGMVDKINELFDLAERRRKLLELKDNPDESGKSAFDFGGDRSSAIELGSGVEAGLTKSGGGWEVAGTAVSMLGSLLMRVPHPAGKIIGAVTMGASSMFNTPDMAKEIAKGITKTIYDEYGRTYLEETASVRSKIESTSTITSEDYKQLIVALNALHDGLKTAVENSKDLGMDKAQITEVTNQRLALQKMYAKLISKDPEVRLKGAKEFFAVGGYTLKAKVANTEVAKAEWQDTKNSQAMINGGKGYTPREVANILKAEIDRSGTYYSMGAGRTDCSATVGAIQANYGFNTSAIGTTTSNQFAYVRKNKLMEFQDYYNMTVAQAMKAGLKKVLPEGAFIITKKDHVKVSDGGQHTAMYVGQGEFFHRTNHHHKDSGAVINNLAGASGKIVAIYTLEGLRKLQGVGVGDARKDIKYFKASEVAKYTGHGNAQSLGENTYKPNFDSYDSSILQDWKVDFKSTVDKQFKDLLLTNRPSVKSIKEEYDSLMESTLLTKADKPTLVEGRKAITKLGVSIDKNAKDTDKVDKALKAYDKYIRDTKANEDMESTIKAHLIKDAENGRDFYSKVKEILDAKIAVSSVFEKDDTKDKLQELKDLRDGKLRALKFISNKNAIDKIHNPSTYDESRDVAIKEKETAITKEYDEQLKKLLATEEQRIKVVKKQIDTLLKSGVLDKKQAEALKKDLDKRTNVKDNTEGEIVSTKERIADLQQDIEVYKNEATYQTNQLFRNFAGKAEEASREAFKFMHKNAIPRAKTEALERMGAREKEANDDMLYNVTGGRVDRYAPVDINMDVSESSMSEALDYLNEEFADTWIGRQMRNMSIDTAGLDKWADEFMNSAVSRIGRHEIFIKYKNLVNESIAKDKGIFTTKDTMEEEARKKGDKGLGDKIHNVNIAGNYEDFEASISQARIDRQTEEYRQLLSLHQQHLEQKKTQELLYAEQDKEMKINALKNNLDIGAKGFEAMGTFMNVFRNKEGKLNKKAFEAQKVMSIGQAIMNTAVSVTEAWKLPTPMNYIQSALAVASGMAQVATIKQQTYHTGGAVSNDGFSNTRSDEVPALLQTGEYVLSRNDMYNIKNGSAKGSNNVPQQPVKNEIVVVNSIDPSVVEQYLTSRTGREIIQNIVRR